MAQKLSMKPNSEQLLELQRVFGQDSPEFKAIIQDLASDKTPQERELDRFFKQHERAFDKRNPQFIKGRSPQSAIPLSAAGMLIPSEIGADQGNGFMDMLNQQSSVLGGPAVSSEEIAAMMNEFSAPPSPAPEMETYSAMDVEISPKKNGMKSSTRSKSVPQKKNADVEMIAQEYSAPAASPAFQQGVQNWSRQNPEMDFTETLLDELTASGSPVRRGSLPKNKKKNPGLRKSY